MSEEEKKAEPRSGHAAAGSTTGGVGENNTPNPLEVCEKEKKEYLEGWQRTKADFINYKKEEGRRMEDMARFVIFSAISDLLPVLDSFDLAFKSLDKSQEQGVLMIKTQLLDVLRRRGLEMIRLKPGEDFNPERHESIGEVESEYPVGTVAEEVQKGYMLRDKVLRPARVRLAKGKLKI